MGSAAVAVDNRKCPSTGRRTNKPLVEKKRRARINGCLGQLKSLILSAMHTENTQVSRLEKADILEMTVKYLRHVHTQQANSHRNSKQQQQQQHPEVSEKFSAGYTECATEVIRYIHQVQCVTPDIRTRLESHLVERLRETVKPVPTAAAAAGSGECVDVSRRESMNVLSPACRTKSEQTACSQVVEAPSKFNNSTNMQHSNNLPPNKQSNVNSYAGNSGNASSACLTDTEAYSRHYQTAVDLANMAAGVIVPANLANTHLSQNASVRAKSSSPLQTGPQEKVHSRKRYNSNSSDHSHLQSTNAIDTRNKITSSKPNPTPIMSQPTALLPKTHDREYLQSFQRPLHIDIPNSPTAATTTSQKETHHQTSSRCEGIMASPSPSSLSSPSPSSSSTITYTHQEQDDAPPTLLYGYNYNLPHGTSSQQDAANAKRSYNSFVAYEHNPEASSPVRSQNAVLNTNSITSYRSYNAGNHQNHNFASQIHNHSATGAAGFYCAPENMRSHPQGHSLPQNSSHQTNICDKPQSGATFPHKQFNHMQECRPGENIDINNNIRLSYYPSFHKIPEDTTLRKNSPSYYNREIPPQFSSNNNNSFPGDNKSFQVHPAEMQSNHSVPLYGNPHTRTSAPAPHSLSRQSEGRRHFDTGNQSPRLSHLVNPINNRMGNERINIVSENPDTSPTADSRMHSHSQLSSPPSNNVTPLLDTPLSNDITAANAGVRPALKKHLLFGQRSDVTHRLPNTESSSNNDNNRVVSPSQTNLHVQLPRTTEDVPMSPRDLGCPTVDAHARDRTMIVELSAKRPCLESVVVTSSCAGHRQSIDDALWRPW